MDKTIFQSILALIIMLTYIGAFLYLLVVAPTFSEKMQVLGYMVAIASPVVSFYFAAESKAKEKHVTEALAKVDKLLEQKDGNQTWSSNPKMSEVKSVLDSVLIRK